jgi:hypothetical protein
VINIDHVYDYPADVDTAFAVIVDPELYEDVAVRSKALEHSANVTHVHQVHTITLERSMPTDQVPSFAKSLVGDALRIHETTWWKAGSPDDGDADGYHATFSVQIVGTPVTFNGTMRLTSTDTGSQQQITGDIKAGIPLLGGKVESSIKESVELQIAAVARMVTERLQG